MPAPDRNRRLTALVVAMAILIATPLAVVAADAFTDVPNDNVHHDDIAWLKDNGVTAGCNPPDNTEFCPGDPVLRQQMASFMRRLAENQVVDAATALEADQADTLDGEDGSFYESAVWGASYDYIDTGSNIALSATGSALLETTVDAPTSGFLTIVGTANVGNNLSDAGWYVLWLEYDDGACDSTSTEPDNALTGSLLYHDASAGLDDFGMSISGITPTAAGIHDVTLCALQTDGDGDAFVANLIVQFAAQGTSSNLSLASAGSGGGPDS